MVSLTKEFIVAELERRVGVGRFESKHWQKGWLDSRAGGRGNGGVRGDCERLWQWLEV
jgi:hypothetical protein